MLDRERVIARVLSFRRVGCTLRTAAAVAGIHVATLYRWQAADPKFRQALRDAAQARDSSDEEEGRPRVPWRRDCPVCRARVVVRAAPGRLRFWRCGRWPLCRWASWRPRASRNCRRCGSPCYWSHSRKSIGCGGCGLRTWPH